MAEHDVEKDPVRAGNDLLKRGEYEAAIEYFVECRRLMN